MCGVEIYISMYDVDVLCFFDFFVRSFLVVVFGFCLIDFYENVNYPTSRDRLTRPYYILMSEVRSNQYQSVLCFDFWKNQF
jgi:hypothetical protein